MYLGEGSIEIFCYFLHIFFVYLLVFSLPSAVLFLEHSFILLDLIDLVEKNIVLNLQLRCFLFEVFHLQFILFDILDVLSLFLLKLVFQLYFLIVQLMVLLFEFRVFETAVLDLSLTLFLYHV